MGRGVTRTRGRGRSERRSRTATDQLRASLRAPLPWTPTTGRAQPAGRARALLPAEAPAYLPSDTHSQLAAGSDGAYRT